VKIEVNVKNGLIYLHTFTEEAAHTCAVIHADELDLVIGHLRAIADSPNYRAERELTLSENRPNLNNACVGI
jgi:hypothetical protein